MDTLPVFVRTLSWDADDVLGIELEHVESRPLPEWAPGAHIGLVLPVGIRHYSLCGDPADRRRYRVAVLLEPASRGGSDFLHDLLRPGHLLDIQPPANHFPLEPASGYRFIAGGIGITPLVPMTRAAQAPYTLTYVGRTRYAMAFAEDLADDVAASVLPRDETDRPDLDQILAAPEPGERVYVCGPPGLVEAVHASARAAGWPEDRVHAERFLPVDLDDDTEAFRFRRPDETELVPVAADESLVTVLERLGVEVESACREGICGTCRIGVMDGEVVHRDAVLTAEERARGDVMMACVSRGRGDLVIAP